MSEMKCPFGHGSGTTNVSTSQEGTSNKDWWPNTLDLTVLSQNSNKVNPMGEDFDYREAFKTLDLEAVKRDITAVLTDSKDWWPADYGNYGPLFIRMAWHSAGTYRTGDGRGGANTGNQRFAPLNSWPDNVNLDKARRLLWPIKQKYGRKLSWGDLMILAGNCAMEAMGLPMIGFGGGRVDVWEPEKDTYWGREKKWLDDVRHADGRRLENPLAATQMGLIYVNPEGPNGQPMALESAKDIRVTFGRMGMNDEETVALIAGGHTFGKSHGSAPATSVGPDPEAAPLEEQGLGWHNSYQTGKGGDTIGSGIEGAWTPTPTQWDNSYFETLFKYEWDLKKSPAGAWQWTPTDPAAQTTVPDAHDSSKTHAPMMMTSDIALRVDPIYGPISRRFLENPEAFKEAFQRAWFKLTHRDMGPKYRYLGADVPEEDFIWQDPVPPVMGTLVNEVHIATLKEQIKNSGLPAAVLVRTAWASASTYRGSDYRGGSNGGRLRLAPQRDWAVNEPAQLTPVLDTLTAIAQAFNAAQTDDTSISVADMIVLGGAAGLEMAAAAAGYDLVVPFTPGRTDATQEQTDVDSFAVLEPKADAFRNYLAADFSVSAEELMVDKSQLLGLTAPEMTVLLGGLRTININVGNAREGVLTDRPGTLSNDFFKNLLTMDVRWERTNPEGTHYIGYDRATGAEKWVANRVDLIFGSNSELRAIAEVYGSDDSIDKFYRDFVAAWNKIMNSNMPEA